MRSPALLRSLLEEKAKHTNQAKSAKRRSIFSLATFFQRLYRALLTRTYANVTKHTSDSRQPKPDAHKYVCSRAASITFQKIQSFPKLIQCPATYRRNRKRYFNNKTIPTGPEVETVVYSLGDFLRQRRRSLS